MANIAFKNGELISAFFVIPITVEEGKPFSVWRVFKSLSGMVDDLGGEKGFAGASYEMSAAEKATSRGGVLTRSLEPQDYRRIGLLPFTEFLMLQQPLARSGCSSLLDPLVMLSVLHGRHQL